MVSPLRSILIRHRQIKGNWREHSVRRTSAIYTQTQQACTAEADHAHSSTIKHPSGRGTWKSCVAPLRCALG